MATRPRHFRKGGVYFITRRVTQQQFLLRPDRDTTQNLTFLLGCALEKFGIELHSAAALSNHIHLIVTDPTGQKVSQFSQWFFSLVARSMNVLRDRTESFWNSQKTSIVEIAPTKQDLAGKIAYVISNPVAAHLVSHAKNWPGLILLANEIGLKEFTAERPAFFYRGDKRATLPDEVRFTSSLPKCRDASPEELLEEIQTQVDRSENEIRVEARAQGTPFLGVEHARKIDVNARPKERAPWRNPIPAIACRNKKLRKAMLAEYRAFQAAYRSALHRYRYRSRDVEFPSGTQKMAWFYRCATEPPGARPWESPAA